MIMNDDENRLHSCRCVVVCQLKDVHVITELSLTIAGNMRG